MTAQAVPDHTEKVCAAHREHLETTSKTPIDGLPLLPPAALRAAKASTVTRAEPRGGTGFTAFAALI
jgi:hypothetical protein